MYVYSIMVMRHENEGLVGAARPPSLLAGELGAFYTLITAVNTANYAARPDEPLQIFGLA